MRVCCGAASHGGSRKCSARWFLTADTLPLDHSSLEGYAQYTQNVAALERARDRGITVHPGQDIEYVVVDDEKSSRDRVALRHECIETYDASYYETQLVRAVESVLSPLGWDRMDIRRRLAGTRDAELSEFDETRLSIRVSGIGSSLLRRC